MQANKFFYKLSFICIIGFFLFGLTSCSDRIGYGVVNWSSLEPSLTAGDIVPVYVRSNISKVYIIGIEKQKLEVPLWQLSFFTSMKEAQAYVDKTNEYRYAYANAKIDGLPLRAKAENTAKQVYRLRQGQTVKILWKGAGEPVIARDKQLEGEWFEVMTNDGTTGWCFSYNLQIFDERESAVGQETHDDSANDPALQAVFTKNWYPESYRKMILKKQINIEEMATDWGFAPGEKKGVAKVEIKNDRFSFPYSKLTKTTTNTYLFEGSSLSMQIRDENTVVLQFIDNNGKPRTETFITLEKTPEEIITEEQERRAAILKNLYLAGPVFRSKNYGKLEFQDNNKFIWNGAKALSPAIIPKNSGYSGYIAVRFFIDSSVKSEYKGVLSFDFDGASEWVNFLYVLSGDSLKLEYIDSANIQDGVVVRRNLNPVILFFQSEGEKH
ncbi:SH3 domain-containing protein [Treponema phagedenis]|uniref:SH3 domain-containing protein n=1 Tax=Treponema phagedenis TaxID=162 RepID=UPI0001F638BB|nr:SH3 domain-containing protein [Treponema phagedenis]EFW36635.1 hypothetical protein HMPREF9554_02923 [Treponema phagedenis F0421]TYT78140.1 SH3 domain-containing protein [Treponema phagedenis]